MPGSDILTSDLRNALLDIGAELRDGRRIEGDLTGLVGLFAALDPANLPQAEREIVAATSLYQWRREWSVIEKLRGTQVSDADQLTSVDGLEYVFIFHRDGRLREAALAKIRGPLANAFLFAAIAWRLNDWVRPVRQAAVDCAGRTFPDTSAEIVADAGMALLGRQATWGRWGTERAVLESALSRDDVTSRFAETLATRATGPMATLLRQAFRSDSLDRHLDHLAVSAIQPSVRAAATRSLINGYTEWPDGWEWRWVDKPMGVRRRETVFARRALTISLNRHDLIRRGLKDRAAAVRTIAISGMIEDRARMSDARQLAATMLADRSRAVRERAEFIINRASPLPRAP